MNNKGYTWIDAAFAMLCIVIIAMTVEMALQVKDLSAYRNEQRCRAALSSNNLDLVKEFCK